MADVQTKDNLNKTTSDSKTVYSGKNYRITVLSERLLRLEYDVNGKFNDNATMLVKNRSFKVPQFKITQDEKYLVITTKYFVMQYTKEQPFKGPGFAPDTNLKVKLVNTDKMWYYGHPEARNFKGSAFSIEKDNERTKLTNGLYSTDGFASLDDSKSSYINAEGSVIKNETNKIDLYLFMYRRDFGLCLKDYFTLTNFPPLIPRYALGIWWYRDLIYNFDDTKKLLQAFNKYRIPLSILMLGEFWHKKDEENYNAHKTGFTFNKKLFKDPSEFTKYIHERGVRLGVNIDPSDDITTFEDKYHEMAENLNVKDNAPIPFYPFNKDFINAYFKYLINPLYDLGVDFFWIDYKKNKEYLNILDYYHTKDFEQFEDRRPLLLSRNPGKGSHNYGVLYSGETSVSWETLKYIPFFNETGSNIGLSWWSHDVGGYKGGIENSELYIRYVESLTFSPIFRFSAQRGKFYKREPWNWDMLTYTIVKDYCQLRQSLVPYLYTEAYKYHKTGIPLIQPLYYYNPEIYDEPLYKDEYFYGTELLVKPITKKKDDVMNRSVERIFLPNGMWYDFKTGKKFLGNKRYVTFFKDEDYPVFAKTGSIVPLAILNENLNDTQPPKGLEIHVFPGSSNVYDLYEDDGVTKLYEKGYFLKTSINFNYMANNYTVTISPIEGKTGIAPDRRDYKIRFRNTRTPEKVEVLINGETTKLETMKYPEDNDYVVYIKGVYTKDKLSVTCMGKDIEIDAVRILNEDLNSIISDLNIETDLKEKIANIIFSDLEMKKKRIHIRKLKREGLNELFVKMFLKLLEYISEI